MTADANSYRYLIVGGGMTADAAVRGIRSVDTAGSIGLISLEEDAPYNRPPLSKGLWKAKGRSGLTVEKVFRKTGERGAELHLGRRVTALDPTGHRVTDDQGATYTYEKLLLATGGFPRRLPFDQAAGNEVIYFRTLADYRRLREAAERGGHFLVIGGGFIGSEVAAALTMFGRQVTMVFPDELIGQRIFPRDLAEYVTEYFRQKGVTLMNNASAVAMEGTAAGRRVQVKSEQTGETRQVDADAVVAGIGIVPATELAEAAGLKVDGGIVVDEGLRTSQGDVYAAGDVARFYSPALGKWMRVEHEDNANTMGTLAGKAMAQDFTPGEPVRYEHLPYFYSDLFDLGYEAVGELDARLETVADWQEPFRKGVVYYLKDGRVRGVLLWDVWGKMEAARDLIKESGPFDASGLRGLIEMD